MLFGFTPLGFATTIMTCQVIALAGNYWKIPFEFVLLAGFVAGVVIGRLDRARMAERREKP